MFGEFVKSQRLSVNLTLREFCRRIDEDASNWSKIERGLMKPPQNEDKLRKIAETLTLTEDSSEWRTLFDYASVDNGAIPEYIMSEKDLMAALPVFFRTLDSVKPTPEEIHTLITILKGESNG